MTGRIVEIAGEGRHLALTRGFLSVRQDGEELGRVPLDDIAAVIANGHGLTYSNNLVLALAERGAAFVLCGPNHAPAAFLWPVAIHHAQSARMRAQLSATRPMGKRLWRDIVRAKLRQQAAVLDAAGKRGGGGIVALARKVKSGDPDNVEAQGARRYWTALFGPDFRRDTAAPGANGMLNYGYAVLRSATARAVMAAGLHPTIGIHHHGPGNPMCLVDDLMEPFRPMVDLCVYRLIEKGIEDVAPDAKAALARLTVFDMQTEAGVSPVSVCLERLAQSVARAFETGEARLSLPLDPLPLDLADAMGSGDGA